MILSFGFHTNFTLHIYIIYSREKIYEYNSLHNALKILTNTSSFNMGAIFSKIIIIVRALLQTFTSLREATIYKFENKALISFLMKYR